MSTTQLHAAASTGSVEQALCLLQRGSTDIDCCCGDDRWTPLMVAAEEGFLRIIRVLLRFGAGVSVRNDRGHTALHISVRNKHLAVTKALIKAGADLEAKADFFATMPEAIQGNTPLHVAAGAGFCEGIVALVDAGATVNSRLNNGSTPLYLAGCCGRVEAVRVLLRAKANLQSGAHEGDTVALEGSAHMNHEDIVALLCDFGVVDTHGSALCAAVDGRAEACVKLLLRRRGGHADIDARAYINSANGRDSLLLYIFELGRFHAPRIARILLDHGADTASNVPIQVDEWTKVSDTPLTAATLTLWHAENHDNVDDETLDGLKGIIRLLHQVEAVHAVSRSWPTNNAKRSGTSIVRKLPVLKRKFGRPTMLAAAMTRCVAFGRGLKLS